MVTAIMVITAGMGNYHSASAWEGTLFIFIRAFQRWKPRVDRAFMPRLTAARTPSIPFKKLMLAATMLLSPFGSRPAVFSTSPIPQIDSLQFHWGSIYKIQHGMRACACEKPFQKQSLILRQR